MLLVGPALRRHVSTRCADGKRFAGSLGSASKKVLETANAACRASASLTADCRGRINPRRKRMALQREETQNAVERRAYPWP